MIINLNICNLKKILFICNCTINITNTEVRILFKYLDCVLTNKGVVKGLLGIEGSRIYNLQITGRLK